MNEPKHIIDERLWPIGAGLIAAVAYALYDERSTRRRVLVNILTGWAVATFLGPAICDQMGVTRQNGVVALSFLLGLFGAMLARYAIEQAEKNPAGLANWLVERFLGRLQPRQELPRAKPEEPRP